MKKTAKNDYVTVARIVDYMNEADETVLIERIKECEEAGYELTSYYGEEEEMTEEEFEEWGNELNMNIESVWADLGYKDFYGFTYLQYLAYNWYLAN